MVNTQKPNLEFLLAALISDGAEEVEFECDHGEWWVSVIEGNTGIGVARHSTEQEMRQVDAVLDRLRKDKSINVNGKSFRLSFRFSENFGEPSWRVRISEQRRQNRTNRRC